MATRRRTFRVGERIQALIASELNRVADPRFNLVTITSCMMSPDLRLAKVYWMVHGGEDRREEVVEAFEAAMGFFRKLVSKELGVKFAPELRFYYDDTLDAAEEMDRLFARIRAGEQS